MTATAMIDSTTRAGATIPTNAHHALGVPSSFVRRSQKVASLNVRERASGTREVEAVPAPSLDRLGRRLSSIVALSAVVPFRWKARDTALNRTASRVARLRIGGVRALLVWAAGPPFAGAKGTTGARLCASRGVGPADLTAPVSDRARDRLRRGPRQPVGRGGSLSLLGAERLSDDERAVCCGGETVRCRACRRRLR